MTISLAQKIHLLNIIHSPCLTEKSEQIGAHHQFVFKVDTFATKQTIKKAIEFIFNVEVVSVRVLNVKGKVKRFKQKLGKRSNWKKAYVALKAGQRIDFETN